MEVKICLGPCGPFVQILTGNYLPLGPQGLRQIMVIDARLSLRLSAELYFFLTQAVVVSSKA